MRRWDDGRINLLLQHPEIIDQLKSGSANLIGVSQVEQQAIIEVLSEDPVRPFVMWN